LLGRRIDFLECFILELDRPNKPLFAAEKFIEGHYEKHSSNNGFVEESHYRLTPHAFSHFTYMVTNGQRIIVDLQGVGDLFTDPQACLPSHTLSSPPPSAAPPPSLSLLFFILGSGDPR